MTQTIRPTNNRTLAAYIDIKGIIKSQDNLIPQHNN